MTHATGARALLAAIVLTAFTAPAFSDPIASQYPWMVKSQTELTHAECLAAMRHDANFWWSRGKCHMKFIRYAMGVATRDVPAKESPDSVLKKGALLTAITQYRPNEDAFCEHGGYCYPAKSVKLLGSVLLGRSDDTYSNGDTDSIQSVGTTCELIVADRKAIIEANAQSMFTDCR